MVVTLKFLENNVKPAKSSRTNSILFTICKDIEHAYIDLNQLLSKAASTSGPSKQIRKKKPKLQVMTPEIRQAITDKKNAYYDWKQNNRPNDPNNQWLQKKKVTTCNLRKECRLTLAKQQLERKSELINAKSNNSNLFFKLIRRQRGRFGMHIDELNVNGQKYNTEGGILEGFREHFANLAKQSDNSQFDQAYIEQVDNEYATIIDICKHDFRHIPVEKQEIMNAIKSLNRNKSPDTYGVTAENLIHGGEILASYLQTLLNSSFEFCFIPDKTIKQILSLPISTADPAIYLLSGLLPINAEIDIKIITLLGNILCSDKSTVEWKIANRQLKIKSCKSNSWFIDAKKICFKYQLTDPVEFLDTITTKETWKRSMVNKIKTYWHRKILDEKEHFNSLQYLSPIYSLGHCHPLISISTSDPKIIQKLPPRVKIATGVYILQSQRAKYNSNAVDPTCQLCKNGEETLSHFLLTCVTLDAVRKPILEKIVRTAGRIFSESNRLNNIELLRLICDPYNYCKNNSDQIFDNISKILEPQCRKMLHLLHTTRYRLLGLDTKQLKKRRKV
ncbi:unnamed protein product [Mytilus edulis]|uniref:Reverse transcriptase zinc-binding domain-containing protein n=1 Tax=Mytilus edulis TaxID=6550 RepID=A0A8S3R1G2_MYTED|nr:unnamed protein product [Mytilus edulis]